MDYDAIIIGSGLAGLTSALLLARNGRKVLVVEQHHSLAPVLSGFERDGIYFDSGFHYAGGLGTGGGLLPLLRHLGVADRLELFPYAPRGFDSLRVTASRKEYTLPVGFDNIKAYLAAQFPAARVEINCYIDEVAAAWQNSPYLDLDAALSSFGMELAHGRSLQQRLVVFSQWPQLQSLLSIHCFLAGVAPEHAPFSLNAYVAGSYYHSAHGIVGGGRQLVKVLLELLREAGVTLKCRADVGEILVTAGAVSGVRLQSGEEFTAATIISTLNPTLLPDLLPTKGLRPVYRKRLKKLRQTFSAYMVFGRSQKSLEFLRRKNLFVQTHPDILGSIDLPLRQRPFYLAGADQGADGAINGVIAIIPTHCSEFSAWEDCGSQRTAAYREWKQGKLEQVSKLLTQSCPELSQLEVLDFSTPLTLRDYSRAPEGAMYGVGRNLGQYNPQPSTKLAGLYLAGQAVVLPGLMGTIISSYMACGTILGHEFLRGELRACR